MIAAHDIVSAGWGPSDDGKSSARYQDSAEGLGALLKLMRISSKADCCIVFETDSDGIAVPIAADPTGLPAAFSLASTRLAEADWSAGAIDARHVRLPGSMVLALGRPAEQVQLIPIQIGTVSNLGLLLLWTSRLMEASDTPLNESSRLAAIAIGEVLVGQRVKAQRQQMAERFNDLFESVPLGIVVIDGDGDGSMVNEQAGSLLLLDAGEIEPATLSDAMRRLREQCSNAEELAEHYAALQSELNYSTTLIWMLNDQQIQVDTHPILGDGGKGRIWLFHDVTAQQRLEHELRRLADHDELTGLSNRRQFELVGARFFAKSSNRSEPLTVLMIDIDHFKSINDRFGHPVGDDVLIAVAARLRGALREEDLIARIGGEEFACALPSTTATDALVVAERLRAAIEVAPFVSGVQTIDVNISIGVAHFDPADLDLDALLARADRALYAAKRDGRNRVVNAGPATAPARHPMT